MYTPPMFKSDRAAGLAFAEARGFGTVCAWDGARPITFSYRWQRCDASGASAFIPLKHVLGIHPDF